MSSRYKAREQGNEKFEREMERKAAKAAKRQRISATVHLTAAGQNSKSG